MKYLLAMAGALALVGCSTNSTADNNMVTVTTANDQVVVADTAAPTTAREAVKDAKNE